MTADTSTTRPALCHVFVFGDRDATPPAGLAESFRREHPGQGTANACFCFDDSYLELLWVTDADALTAPAIAPAGLAARAAWRETGACPFGIALRGALPVPGWEWTPPYLPPGLSITVADLSADPRQPFVFRSPGAARPDAWTDGRAGARQMAAGLTEVTGLTLALPAGIVPHPDLLALAGTGLLTLETGAPAWRLGLTVARADGGASRRIDLPEP